MSLMQAQKQRDLKYPGIDHCSTRPRDLGWSTMFAELRSHGSLRTAWDCRAAQNLRIALAVRGSDEGLWRPNSPGLCDVYGRQRARSG